MSNKSKNNDKQEPSGPIAVEVESPTTSAEELDLAQLEEERKRFWGGIAFMFYGSAALIGLFYLLHEIFR